MADKRYDEFAGDTPLSTDIILFEQLSTNLLKQVTISDLLGVGGVQSVTGYNVDNADPVNPIILPLEVDNLTVFGAGILGDPLRSVRPAFSLISGMVDGGLTQWGRNQIIVFANSTSFTSYNFDFPNASNFSTRFPADGTLTDGDTYEIIVVNSIASIIYTQVVVNGPASLAAGKYLKAVYDAGTDLWYIGV